MRLGVIQPCLSSAKTISVPALAGLITLDGLRPTASTPATTMSISQDDFLPSIYRSKQEFLASLPPWRRP